MVVVALFLLPKQTHRVLIVCGQVPNRIKEQLPRLNITHVFRKRSKEEQLPEPRGFIRERQFFPRPLPHLPDAVVVSGCSKGNGDVFDGEEGFKDSAFEKANVGSDAFSEELLVLSAPVQLPQDRDIVLSA